MSQLTPGDVPNLANDGYARTAGEDGYFLGPFVREESALYIGSSAGTTHVVPVTESAVNTEQYQNYLEENPIAVAATLELDYGISSPIYVGYAEYRNNLIETLENVLINDLDEQEALTELDTTTEEIISSNN